MQDDTNTDEQATDDRLLDANDIWEDIKSELREP